MKQRRELAERAPVVPSDFWAIDQMRDALASWHMGRVIAAFRNHPFHGRPLPQAVVAGWVGISQVQLSRIETGPALKDLDRLMQWARILQVPTESLWFKLPEAPAAPVPAPAVPMQFGSRSEAEREHSDGGDLPAMQAFRLADRQVGGGHLYANVVRYLERSVAPRLFGMSRSSEVNVFSAAAALTEMAGWMAHDVGRDELARQHFDRARSLAAASADVELEAHILASLSHLAYEQHDLAEAVGLARTGQQRATQGPTSPVVAARLFAMEARGLAARGERQSCVQVLDQARVTLAAAPGGQVPSVWVSAFDPAALASEAADCFRQLGVLDEAEREAREAVALRSGDRARSRALGQLTLAEIHVAQGRYDEACAVGSEVLDATGGLSSVRVLRQLTQLQTRLAPVASTATTDFAGRLGAALGERAWWYTWAQDVTDSEREPGNHGGPERP
ncbi:helix-turn-helix domain-containing protein [Catenulispora rubra]|uniref:helix-turn-helix domain-containing protein n=1 Tax=Catenulispora rubra TaxID=280293 RepID=UPI001892560C|nr:helix-turn-helix transcriptional regulator [Catenulispora rubra]